MLRSTNHYGYKEWSPLLASHNKHQPFFDLAIIKEAAAKENIEYGSRKVRRDIANLGYELADVILCLQGLTDKNFDKSHTYQQGHTLMKVDAYIYTNKRKTNDEEELEDILYIKFSLVEQTLIIDLASFHLSS